MWQGTGVVSLAGLQQGDAQQAWQHALWPGKHYRQCAPQPQAPVSSMVSSSRGASALAPGGDLCTAPRPSRPGKPLPCVCAWGGARELERGASSRRCKHSATVLFLGSHSHLQIQQVARRRLHRERLVGARHCYATVEAPLALDVPLGGRRGAALSLSIPAVFAML